MATEEPLTSGPEPLVSMVTVVSLLVTAVYAGAGVMFSMVLGKHLSRVDVWVLAWLVFDVLIHLTLEGPFVVISLFGTVLESEHFTALVWKEYAKADYRWGVSDPTIVSLEFLTVTIVEVFAVVLIYAIIKDKHYRHFIQISLCVCELYGGWMTFCPEWLTGSKYLNTDNFLYMWVYLVFFNMLWVVIPLGMLWQSWVELRALAEESRSHSVQKQTVVTTTTRHTYNTRSKSQQKTE